MMNLEEQVSLASDRIRGYVRETPLELSPFLSEVSGARVHCKLENWQHTGSFKVRGALNKLLSLSREEREHGVVAASTGNHGAAVAHAMDVLSIGGEIFVTEHANPAKVATIERLGARIVRRGNDCLETEAHARRHAAERGMVYVSPYNDPAVIAGQGTIGEELVRQHDWIDEIFIALGGGGLISGVAGYLKSQLPEVHVVGCSPANSCVMIDSLRAGRILDLPSQPTLSDGTAGGVEDGSITFELCRELVDECVTVSEEEIATSLRRFIEIHRMLIEGAAAVPLAAFRRSGQRLAGKEVVIVLCGGNIDLETLRGAI